jgi:alpha-mannosidase
MKHEIRWTAKKIAHTLDFIEPLIYRQQIPFEPFRFRSLPGPDSPIPSLDEGDWQVIQPNTYWGQWMTDFVLMGKFHIPADWDVGKPVALYLPLGEAGDFSHPEAQIIIDGEIYAAVDRHHQEIRLDRRFANGEEHQLALRGWTGLGQGSGGPWLPTRLFMRSCKLVQIDPATRKFFTLAKLALDTTGEIEDSQPVRAKLLNSLDEAFLALDLREPPGEAFYESIPDALKVLQDGISKSGSSLDTSIIVCGHAHLDVAWLWTVEQARNKAARTFSTALHLMDEFPRYHFSQSQAQLYEFIQQDHPDIFARIQERVLDGQWEVMGGTWVEPDCNAIGAESLVRQFILGRSYFRQQFGDNESPVLWLPDTFGYSWALPQIIKECGIQSFVTHKLSWNQYNDIPYQSFWWQGLDGTRVLTHFLTTPGDWEGDINQTSILHSTTYNAIINPRDVMGTWRNYRHKETHQQLLMAYGYGDGGGGPTREMLLNMEHMDAFPGLPQVIPGKVGQFMKNLEEQAGAKLPVWNGELYLEYHRGTYTSQAHAKRSNRKCEFLLHDTEFLATLAALHTDYQYPKEKFVEAWKLLSLNQFHDILPGSSITFVYMQTEQDYENIEEILEDIQEEAVTALSQMLPERASFVAINPTSFGGKRIAFIPLELEEGQGLADIISHREVITQHVEGGTLASFTNFEPYSLRSLQVIDQSLNYKDHSLRISLTENGAILENEFLLVEIDKNGEITRLYDREYEREVLPAGERANVLQAFEDRPLDFDAWDIDIYFEDKCWTFEPAECFEVVEEGPLRIAVEVQRKFRSSTLTQRICLYRSSRRIDFDTQIDWNEHHILLKVAFPVDILNTQATYDVQWGNVQRPTHRNTSWDWARFETCAHKWVDLSQGDYGVSLLNDCKYGHDIHDNVMRLSLLKSATIPDPFADQGEHQVVYSLYPHAGDWRSGTVQAAYDLNDSLFVHEVKGAGRESWIQPLVNTGVPNVIVETIKAPESGDGIIVRLYENERSHTRFTLQFAFDLQAVYRCNMLEEETEVLPVTGNQVKLEIDPYKILTLRLIPKPATEDGNE